MKRRSLNKEDAITVSGYTGFLCCHLEVLKDDIEKRIGRKLLPQEFENNQKEIKKLYQEDFIAIANMRNYLKDE